MPTSEETNKAITLPIAALHENNGVDQVWVVDQSTGTVTPKEVRLAERAAGDGPVRVLSGLREGETVVVAGINELSNGQKVKLEGGLRP